MNIDELRVLFGGDVAHDARSQLLGVLPRRKSPKQRDVAAIAHQGPAGLGFKLADFKRAVEAAAMMQGLDLTAVVP